MLHTQLLVYCVVSTQQYANVFTLLFFRFHSFLYRLGRVVVILLEFCFECVYLILGQFISESHFGLVPPPPPLPTQTQNERTEKYSFLE